MSRRSEADTDSDAREIAHASRRVAAQLMMTMTLIAVIALTGAFVFVLRRIPPHVFFGLPLVDHRITVGARDMLLAGIGGSIAAVVLAGAMTIVLTRRAVRPLGDALRIQRSFVADASHELRTPLTVLDARVQIIQRMIPRRGELAEEVAELRDDTRALIGIVNDLLAAADVTGDTPISDATPLRPLVEGIVAQLTPLSEQADVSIAVVVDERLTVAIPVARAERCLLILIDNALQHSPPGSTVTVTGSSRRDFTVIRVQDQGDGIRGIAPARVFERFAHSDESRVSTQDSLRGRGYGIGLSLVRDTAVRSGGDVRVDDTATGGAAFELLLPAEPRTTRR
jgi:signal transduction histidine kinase